MAVTEDCNCRVPPGFVKAQRLRGHGSGSWGSASAGEWAIVPSSLVEERPDLWEAKQEPAGAPEQPVTASEDLEGMTVADLTQLAAERGVELPRKARKAEIVEVLSDA